MNNNIFNLIKDCIAKIKDELLLFSVVAILIIVSFPQAKLVVFLIYIVAVILYSIIKIKKSHTENNRFLENFEKYLIDKNAWEKRWIENDEIYFYKKNNNYKIERSKDVYKEWTAKESWMRKFPDPSIDEWRVCLKFGESKISEFGFLSCDGGRYFIPIPEKKCVEKEEFDACKKWEYFWKRESLEYKVGEIIGTFYSQKNLEETAKFCEISIK